MHDMSSFDKTKALFLRRKHKLYKSLSQPPSHSNDIQPRNDIICLVSTILNKENQASQLDYFIKHDLKADLTPCMPLILNIIWGLLDVRCGRVLSFVAYRMCRKYPAAYWSFLAFIAARLEGASIKTSQQTVFLTDLYLYGFAITSDQFVTQLFPHFQRHMLDLLPKYFNLLQSNEFFSLRHQRIFLEYFRTWMENERLKVQLMHDGLVAQSCRLQEKLIAEMEDEDQELQYSRGLEDYETQLFRFTNAALYLKEEVEVGVKVKSIFELKKECRTFKLSFQYSDYQKSLYLGEQARELRPLKKSQMLRMEESEAFVTRVKLCCSVEECLQLGGYFLEQLNTQHNREQLIEVVINDCYHYNNLAYVLKVVHHITLAQPSLLDYCSNKAKKICAQSRMNPKYQKLLCEMCRFALIDENILLDYCERVVRVESSQATKEIEAILEHLGTMVYYRSLRTHTRINELFERMEAIMKAKLVHFSIEQVFHLKGLLNYLRTHANKLTPEAQDIAALEIKTNFPFILKKMERLLKEDQPQKVLQFVAAGIDHQDFLNSYYYASLIRDLNHKPLHHQVHALAISSITASLPLLDAQRSVCWSRFLGELYNYEIISRRKLIEDLADILHKYQEAATLSSSLKCICATLETAKHYLKESEINRDQRQVISFILDLKKIVCLNTIDQLLYDEIAELTEYFHPFLSHIDSIERIYAIIELSEQPHQTLTIYAILDLMQNGATIESIKTEQRPDTKRRYTEKEMALPDKKTMPEKEKVPVGSEKKWVQKAVRYREKEDVSRALPNTEAMPVRQSPSKQSIKTEQTHEGRVQVRQIKVMGRGRGDKRVRVVTATYSEPLE